MKKEKVAKQSSLNELYSFTLNEKVIDFSEYVCTQIGLKGKKEELKFNDYYHSLATMLFAVYKKKQLTLNTALKTLHSRLFLDYRLELNQAGERPTEKVLDANIYTNDEYLALVKRQDAVELRITVLYGIMKQTQNRREDIRTFYGSGDSNDE